MGLGTEIALIKALGGALPPITAADNGKVLTADSGVWVAQEQEFEFMASSDPSDPYKFYPQSGVSFTEVAHAYMQGRKVYLMIQYESGINIRIPLAYVAESRVTDPDTGAVTRVIVLMVFSMIDLGSTYITFRNFEWQYDNETLSYKFEQVEHE